MSVTPFPNLDEARRKKENEAHTKDRRKKERNENIMSQVRKVSWLEMDGREEGKEEKPCGKGERKSAEKKFHALPEGQAMDNRM